MEQKNVKLFEKLVGEGPVSSDKLLNEDEILTDEDKKKPDTEECGADNNGEKKPKKPCANCTCGLADELEKEAKNKVSSEQKDSSNTGKSSCGSCYLGDAFRCASCPYRGMPAFKPGEKVTIDVASDDI